MKNCHNDIENGYSMRVEASLGHRQAVFSHRWKWGKQEESHPANIKHPVRDSMV